MMLKSITAKYIALLAVLALLNVGVPGQSEQPSESRLLNGLRVLVFKKPAEQKVTIRLRIHSGAAFDPLGKEGTMELLSRALFPNEELRDFFREDLGGSLTTSTGYDHIQISATADSGKLLDALEPIAAGVTAPQIGKEVTAKVKVELLEVLKTVQGQALPMAAQATAASLVGNYPYGRPVLGSSASVQRIDFADLLQADERFATADNATIIVSGDVDPVLVTKAVRRFFGGWNKSDRKIPLTFAQPESPKQKLVAQEWSLLPSGTAAKLSAVRVFARKDPKYPASAILAAVLRQRLTLIFPAESIFTDFGHALPGIWVFGGRGTDQGVRDVDPLTVLSSEIGEGEFASAKAEVMKKMSGSDSLDLWLDIDTYGAGKPDSEIAKLNAVTLTDVSSVLSAVRNATSVTNFFTAPAAPAPQGN